MKYSVATLCLLAVSISQAFGAAISDETKDTIKKLDVTTCYHNLRACYWENSSASKIAVDGGLENLIKKCHTDFAGCDKTALETAFKIIKDVAAKAGGAARIAGSTVQKIVNDAMDAAFEVAKMTGQIANDAVNTAGDIASEAANQAGKIANDAINTAGDIAKEATNIAKDAINEAADFARGIFGRIIHKRS